MSRPSFQFYPADWLADVKLKACSHAEKGAWIDLLCLLHQSPEYGILRVPLKRLAYMIHARIRVCTSLFEKHVLEGSDTELSRPLIFTPYHARQEGIPVTLIPAQQGPIWFSGRMVRDEYKLLNAGKQSRFGSPSRRDGESPCHRDGERHGERHGDGSSSSSSSSSSSINKTTVVPTPTVTPARTEMRGFGKNTEQKTKPNWKVPSLDDQEGLDRYAREQGVNPERFNSYPELQAHLIQRVKEENAAKRGERHAGNQQEQRSEGE